jgi:hypothetical protein
MLDVHPPHRPTHTCKDFFIHIAIIVVGLLIAVGIEQTVEAIHRHEVVAETSKALRAERVQNRLAYAANAAWWRLNIEELKNDMLVLKFLQLHPGTPEEKLPGVLLYGKYSEDVALSAWKTAQQNGVTQWMPHNEVESDTLLYEYLERGDTAAGELWEDVLKAREYASRDPDLSHMTPAQIEKQMAVTQDCIAHAYNWATALENTSSIAAKDFTGGPSMDEINEYINAARSSTDHLRIEPARQRTHQRLEAVGSKIQPLAQAARDNAAKTHSEANH